MKFKGLEGKIKKKKKKKRSQRRTVMVTKNKRHWNWYLQQVVLPNPWRGEQL